MTMRAVVIGVMGILVGCGGKVGGVDPSPSPGGERVGSAAADEIPSEEVEAATGDIPGNPPAQKTMQAACGAAVIDVLDCATDAGYEVNSYRAQLHGDPEVNVIGIYESRSDHRGADYHPMGEASVHVSRRGRQILVLSSYEPTHWTVTLDPGTSVVKVVTLGYYEQPVIFRGESTPVEQREYACGYSWPYNGQGCDTNQLFASSERAAHSPVAGFAGCYRANTFVVRDDQEICR
jgi:hypothetical protein